MELWDAYDRKLNKQNFDLIRGEKIPKGYFHLVVEVLVRHKDGSYLLMKRASTKQIQPNKFEASAGGSALKGETALLAVKRELFEETGIISNEFTHTYTIISEKHQTIFKGFITTVDIAKNSIILQKDETDDFMWLDETKFLAFIHTDHYLKENKDRLLSYLFDKSCL